MKHLILLAVVLVGSVASAQEPVRVAANNAAPADPFANLMPTPTPEMWFYAQEMRRYDDPKEMVRRNAEFRAAERRSRIARAKWMGHSKARPTVEHTPFTSNYAPLWVTRPLDPYYWVQDRASIYSATNYSHAELR